MTVQEYLRTRERRRAAHREGLNRHDRRQALRADTTHDRVLLLSRVFLRAQSPPLQD
jgi:hypothetical protein